MEVEEKAWEIQEEIESRIRKLGKGKYGRVLKMARKPTMDEYKKILQITGLGIVVLGLLGFVIMWLMNYLPELL
ncbi:MAG: protein transport protein subunit gamma [Candidatus Methanomethylophilaceae archaeon]|nr:protein transport protein subunit gamma [Candidatus Methanomethylophilaceae archaeon]MDI3541360.1 protein transport protein subunit gamma [Candidatus Methanomethylophilaceae archaeon]HIJ00321.1 protein translocase SEC61 complex subunit gamma [Candidatus Methanomethylophilaceae archaeon]